MKGRVERARAVLLASALWPLALGACAEPSLVVVVSLPEGIDRDGLTVELSVFAPAEESEVDCDKIAYGDVRLPELRAARLHHQLLLSPEGSPRTVESQATTVDRSGTKLALALGAYAYEGGEIDDVEAVLAGCVEIGEVEGDTRVELATGPSASVVVPAPHDLFFSAVLGSAESTPVVVERRGPDGALVVQPGGLAVQLADYAQRPVATSVRFRVLSVDGGERYTRTVGPGSELASTLQVDRAGPFVVDVRARFQRGLFEPLPGLAYRELLDSDEQPDLAGVVDGAAWVRPVLLSGPDGEEVAGYLSTPPASNPAQHDLVLATVGPDLRATAQPLLGGLGGRPPELLGEVQVAVPEPRRVALVATHPPAAPDANDPCFQNTCVRLLPAPGLPPTLAVEPGFEPVVRSVGLSPCSNGDQAMPLLLGMSDVDPLHPWLSRYQLIQLIDLNGGQQALVSLEDHADDPDPNTWLLRPQPLGFTQSLCLDNQMGAVRRLLGLNDGRSTIYLPLDGTRVPTLQDIGDIAMATTGASRALRIEGSVESSLVLAHQDRGRRVLLAAVWLDDRLEVNQYALEQIGPGEELGFEANLFQVSMLPRPIAARLAVGHFLLPSSEAPDQLDLALLVAVISEVGYVVSQIYISPLAGSAAMGLMPLRITQMHCAPPNDCLQLARHSDLLAHDLDGDGRDELLLVTKEGDPSRWRAQVMGFAP